MRMRSNVVMVMARDGLCITENSLISLLCHKIKPLEDGDWNGAGEAGRQRNVHVLLSAEGSSTGQEISRPVRVERNAH